MYNSFNNDIAPALSQKQAEMLDDITWSYLKDNWSEEPVLLREEQNYKVYKYVLKWVTRYRKVPNTYNPTQDWFYEDENLTILITNRW